MFKPEFNEENIRNIAMFVNEFNGVITVDNIINEFLYQHSLMTLPYSGFPKTHQLAKRKIIKVLHKMVNERLIFRGTSFEKGHPYMFFTNHEAYKDAQALQLMWRN